MMRKSTAKMTAAKVSTAKMTANPHRASMSEKVRKKAEAGERKPQVKIRPWIITSIVAAIITVIIT